MHIVSFSKISRTFYYFDLWLRIIKFAYRSDHFSQSLIFASRQSFYCASVWNFDLRSQLFIIQKRRPLHLLSLYSVILHSFHDAPAQSSNPSKIPYLGQKSSSGFPDPFPSFLCYSVFTNVPPCVIRFTNIHVPYRPAAFPRGRNRVCVMLSWRKVHNVNSRSIDTFCSITQWVSVSFRMVAAWTKPLRHAASILKRKIAMVGRIVKLTTAFWERNAGNRLK